MHRFCLLISIHPLALANRGLGVLSESLETIEKSGTPVPVSWNTPTIQLCDRSDSEAGEIRERLVQRMRSANDSIVAMGLTGASHRFLTSEEIELELAWALENIWMSGLRDCGPAAPALFVPPDPDPFRQSAREAYEACERPVLIPALADDGLWLVRPIASGASPGGACRLVRVAPDAEGTDRPERQIVRAVKKRMRRRSGTDDQVVILQATLGLGGGDILGPLLQAASTLGAGGWEPVPLKPELVSDPSKPQPVSAGLPVVAPHQAETAQALRSRRSSKINTVRVLETLCGRRVADVDASTNHAPNGGAEREFIATMMGRATITGTRISAAFDGGRFAGFVPAAEDLTGRKRKLDGAAHVATTAGEDERTNNVLSCFSFETEVSRGIRAHSTLNVTTEFRVETDAEYAYAGDTDALIFSLRIREPADGGELTVPDPSTAIYLLATHITNPRALSMRVVAPDGARIELSPHELQREDAVVGSAIEIRNGRDTMTIVYTNRSGVLVPRALPLVSRNDARGGLSIAVGGIVPLGLLAAAGHSAIDWEAFTTTGIIVPGGLDEGPLPGILAHRPPAALRRELEATGLLPG